MKKFSNTLIFFFLLLLVAVAFGTAVRFLQVDDSRLQQAEENYRKGENATTIAERKEAFNNALTQFLSLEEHYHPSFGSGKLQYAIGNTFFQLEEYPLSILYYKKAETLLPRSGVIKNNLSKAYQKLGLAELKLYNFLDKLLLKPYFSLPERLQFFSVSVLLFFIFLSLWIWTKKSGAKKIALLLLLPLSLILINLGVSFYFSPTEAVLIQAAELRRDAGFEFAKVGDQPIVGGTTVEVVSISQDGHWLKIITPDNTFGYVPSQVAKLIDLQ